MPIRASAPGRICLFGEHQDYLGLPVIASAVNLRIGVEETAPSDGPVRLDMPDISERALLDLAVDQEYASSRDYLRSCVNVLRRRGVRWPRAHDLVMRSDIPVNAGLSSSSAMVVMWLRYLISTGVPALGTADEDLARLGHEAEVTEFHEPGGMMDHYCAALGGVLYIDTRPPFAAERLGSALNGFVVGNSLEPKATVETLRARRSDVQDGIDLVTAREPRFSLAETPIDQSEELLAGLPDRPARRLRANLVNRDITRAARETLGLGDAEQLGRLLSLHHAQLRDGLDLSTPKIERMLDAALSAGALGGKVNGSGGGGTMFVFAPGYEQEVAEAIRAEGGDAYIVCADEGARIDSKE